MADLLQPTPARSWPDRLALLRDQPWFGLVAAAAGAVVAVAVLVAVGLSFLRASAPAPKLTLPQAEPGAAPATGAPAPGGTGTGTAADGGVAHGAGGSAPPATVTVHVAGQVAGPGVYAVPAAGRVADAVVAAGGTTAEADVAALNLAARLSDGERIYVPRKGEQPPPAVAGPAPAAPKSGTTASPLDLNTATAEQLDALPGVGPATSKAILDYRSRHGRFRSVTELLEVAGIGPAKLEALRPLVRV